MSTKEIHDPGDKETKPHPFDLTSLPSIEFLATIFLFTSPPDSLKPVPNLPYANVQLSLSQSLPYFLMPKPSFCQSLPNAEPLYGNAFLMSKPTLCQSLSMPEPSLYQSLPYVKASLCQSLPYAKVVPSLELCAFVIPFSLSHSFLGFSC